MHVSELDGVYMDLMAIGYVRTLDQLDRGLLAGVKIELTQDGLAALQRQRNEHRTVCGKHHDLGSRLANWLREHQRRMTWENITFSRDYQSRAQCDELDGWTEIRPDVYSCVLTPTARLAKTETFEIKVSTADFNAELAKPQKLQAARDIAEAAWFCVPQGLVDASQLPQGFGLLAETAPGEFKVLKRPKRKRGFVPSPDVLMTLVRRRASLPEDA